MAGLLLAGDAFAFLDPVFSSGVMLALKSGTLAGDEVHKAIVERDFSPARFAEYGRLVREGVENMRKLVYAFYDPKFSFRKLTNKYPERRGHRDRLPERRCQQRFFPPLAANRRIRPPAPNPSPWANLCLPPKSRQGETRTPSRSIHDRFRVWPYRVKGGLAIRLSPLFIFLNSYFLIDLLRSFHP